MGHQRSRRVRQRRTAPADDRWLLAYADVVTLLFAVFTALYASSTIDRAKLARMQFSARSAFATPVFDKEAEPTDTPQMPPPAEEPAEHPEPTAPEAQKLLRVIEQISNAEIVQGNIRVEKEDDRVVVSLNTKGFFKPGSATLRKSSLPVLAVLADKLARLGRPLDIEGHTDPTPPMANFASNWALSAARAASVAEYLSQEFGYPSDLMHISAYASSRPRYSNATAQGRAANRRVSIVILSRPPP